MYYSRFRVLLSFMNDVHLHVVSLRVRKLFHNKFIFPIGYLAAFYIFNNRVSKENSYFFVLLLILWFPFCRCNLKLQLFLSCFVTRYVFLYFYHLLGEFNDLYSDRQSNLWNVLISFLLELYLKLLIFNGHLGFNSVSDIFDSKTLTQIFL